MSNIHIAVLMMVKNEKKRLHVTLNSIKDFADSLIIFDTGSTDETIQILKDFSNTSGIPLRLKEGEFVDFSTSRNISLDFADTFEDVNFILLLDTNDELKGGDELRKFAISEINTETTAYLVAQEWWSGQYDKYYNMRFIKARKGWRYKGVVHEWLKNTKEEEEGKGTNVIRISSDIKLYQDRTQDDDKSSKRFIRDKKLLLDELKVDPLEPRTLFYLAQTFSCLREFEDSFYYYKIRSTVEGFQEEKFHAYFRAGELAEILKHDWYDCMSWYMKAFEHSQRAEPLVKIAEYYRKKNNWILSFTFADLACKLTYPEYCILFVDKKTYDYTRWHLLGIVGYYAGFYKEGKIACEIACKSGIEYGINCDIDNNNLKFYQEKEKEKEKEKIIQCVTKKDYINLQMQQLSSENSKFSKKQLETKAKNLWKNRNIKN
jgi:glycosyltransferase involved in cell wall biosynthesis